MELLSESHFLIILILGIFIIIGIPFFMLIRLLHKIHNRFELIEKELKRLNETEAKK